MLIELGEINRKGTYLSYPHVTRHGHKYLTYPATWAGKWRTHSRVVIALVWFGCVTCWAARVAHLETPVISSKSMILVCVWPTHKKLEARRGGVKRLSVEYLFFGKCLCRKKCSS
jgi:hypothetical protein